MGAFLFELKKDLLELGALEMDSVLQNMFASNSKNTVTLRNEKGITRTFTVDLTQNILEGRGIIGFFGDFRSEYLFIERMEDGAFTIYENPKPSLKGLKDLHTTTEAYERAKTIIDSMNRFSITDNQWMQLYEHAWEFTPQTIDNELLCLQHVRDLDLYQYQLNTVKMVLNRFRGRVLMCDEVGLGKTIEAGMAMLEYIVRGLVKKILILVPPSLMDQWYYEMKRKFNLDFIRSDEPAFRDEGDTAWQKYDKVIASLSTAKRKPHSDHIASISYDLLIVDEAHHVKNRRTLAWEFVNRITKKYIFLLSATPVQNKMEELYNLITLLKPGQLRTYGYFKRHYVEDSEGLQVKNVDQLRQSLSQVMIRNKRSDVDIRLPKRTASTITVPLLKEEKTLYDDMTIFIRSNYNKPQTGLSKLILKTLQEEMGSSFHALLDTLEKMLHKKSQSDIDREKLHHFYERAGQVVKMNQPTPKAEQLAQIIDQFQDKMIVFTKYVHTQSMLTDYIKSLGYETAVFHGGLVRKQKEEQIAFFKDRARVLISTESGGEGRNLQFCNAMVNYDVCWNPMAIEQRIGRIHRVGQTRDVYVFNLAAKQTVEQYILDLLDRKINMFELVVGEVDMILGDIEDKTDFSNVIMDAWVRSADEKNMEIEMDVIAAQLQKNKEQYMKAKQLDHTLFSNHSNGRGDTVS